MSVRESKIIHILYGLFLLLDTSFRVPEFSNEHGAHLVHGLFDCAPDFVENAFLLLLRGSFVLSILLSA